MMVNEKQLRLPLRIDTGALIIGEYVILDSDRHIVRYFDTEEEAEAFVAEANESNVETVRRQTAESARMLAEYRENLIRKSRPA